METDARRHPLLVGTVVAVVALLVAFGAAAAVAGMGDDEPEARPVDAELRFLPEHADPDNPLESGDATGTPVPETKWEKLDGSGLGSFADYEGKPVVVNFFGSWCAPCRKEMPALQEVYEDIGDEVAFLGLAVQESARESQAFVEEMGTTYDIGRDPSGKILTHFGVVNFPSTYLVSPDGKIIAARAGELDAKELRELVADNVR